MSLYELSAAAAGVAAANTPPGAAKAEAPTPEDHRDRLKRLG